MASVLIQGARLLDSPRAAKQELGDVLIEGGKITAVDGSGKIPASKASQTIDARGAWLLAGVTDCHVHLREPGHEYKETIETGTRSAVSGGFSAVACMANTLPVNDSGPVTAYIREKAKAHGHCTVHPIGALSKGLKGEELAEIGSMVREGVRAISDDGMPVMNSYLMRKAMDYARAFGVPIISHAEDACLVGQGVMNEGPFSNELGLRGNPAAAEEILVAREIALCRLTKCRVHIAHLSTEQAIRLVRRAKEDGLPITAEATPHHLSLTDANVGSYDTHFKMAPPLRSERDRKSLQEALADGTVDLLATDHAPHGTIDKCVEFDQAANGIIGLETALPATLKLVTEGKLSLARWVDAWTDAPAKLLGLETPRIAVGATANLTLFENEKRFTFSPDSVVSKSRNSPFLGTEFQGQARMTWVGGRLAFSL